MDYLKVPKLRQADWILNTPERREILNEGAPQHANHKLLGKGAFGSVFKAIFQDRPVALKIVKNRSGINRTENEANILGWKHENIVQILIIESTINYGLIIMEHFPSKNLQQILDAIELPLVHRIFISLDILSALAYCHTKNLLHLDVKPQNVLVAFKKATVKKSNRNYSCKLCDFGSSFKLDDKQTNKIKAGGTIRYMSPEALRAAPLTPAADIFSLGILMWQLQQRQSPYDIIQCNEIVAFQVVKHGLRPNDDLSRFSLPHLKADSPMHHSKNCICKCLSTESRHNSKRYTKLDNFAATPFKRNCHSAKKDLNVILSISPNVRTGKSIQILHSTAKKQVARNLNRDFNSFENSTNIENPLSLNFLFQSIFNWSTELLKSKEKAYSKIYESCWQAAPEMRPEVKVLKLKLKKLINN